MASPTKRVYWDACTWIAVIQKEKIQLPNGTIEDRETMGREVIEAAKYWSRSGVLLNSHVREISRRQQSLPCTRC